MAKHKYIESPEKLWELFEDYVFHEKSNPMYKQDYVGKEGRVELTPLETPITFEGFECYLMDRGVIGDLGHYSNNKDNRYSEYVTIITRIRKNCFVHNFRGASVGLFNANIIAKKLGLSDKVETQQTIVQKFDFDVND
jgi:hypothetical protein